MFSGNKCFNLLYVRVSVIVMKKIISILSIFAVFVFASPVLATCSITGGACSIQDLEKTSSSNPVIQNELAQTYNETPIIETLRAAPPPTYIDEQNIYDANCQFGVCLPGMMWDRVFGAK